MARCYRVLFVLSLMIAMGEHLLQATDRPKLSSFWTIDRKAGISKAVII